ncbi:hypothetical protein D3C75_1012770 [compost metagenome]
MSVLQNWLESDVNSSGAVSPAIRAIASNTPVIIPETEAFSVMAEIIFHFGVPNAYAASRRLSGTSFSMFSVVRITIGTCNNASAITPAQPEKCCIFATTMV